MSKKVDTISVISFYRSFLLLIFLCLSIACSNENGSSQNETRQQGKSTDEINQWAKVKLPDLSLQPIRLRVASVVNPRFKQLSDAQIKRILTRSQQMVKQHFDIDVEFYGGETLVIDEVFSRLEPKVKAIRRSEIVDLEHIDTEVREKMQQSLYKTLSNYSGNRQNVIDFAQPHLLHPDVEQIDFTGLSYALVDTLIARLGYWKNQTAADGKPVLSDDEYNEWVWWDSLGYSDLSYDVLITNQLVASAEYYAMDVHSSIRGGITAGTTTFNRNTALGSYVYIMVYPLLNDTDLLTRLRSDKSYTEEQVINYAAALLTHELGHLLFHFGHPFGNKSCIMSPTMMLNYREWYDNLDARKCVVGSSIDMTPGSAKIDYNRSW